MKDVPLGNSPDLTYAGVIPYIIHRGQDSYVIAKSNASGDLGIDIYTRDDKTKIKNIYQGSIIWDGDGLKGFRMIKWSGIDPEKKITFKGAYLVRWTLNGKHQDRTIKIE